MYVITNRGSVHGGWILFDLFFNLALISRVEKSPTQPNKLGSSSTFKLGYFVRSNKILNFYSTI